MAHVSVTLQWFKLTRSWDGDDEEDLDVSITVNGHVLYAKHNENHYVGREYGQDSRVELDVEPARVHIVGAVTCADYHHPDYGSSQRQHVENGTYGLSSALNNGAWEARYQVVFS